MLVDGRTWEYYVTPFPDGGARKINRTLKGTVEKFGKTWHVLDDSVAFLREENGKVFILAQHSGKLNRREIGDDSIMVNAGDEFILYDFSAATQTEYIHPYFFKKPTDKGVVGYYNTVRVKETEKIKMGDKEVVRQLVKPFWKDIEGGYSLYMTEGLGVMEYGTLNSFMADVDITGQEDYPTLARVTDAEGKAVYQRYTSEKMIQEGRVWEYWLHDDDSGVEKFIRYGFKGTTEKNGRTYHNLTDLDNGSIVALMREEDYKVWLLLEGGEMQYHGKDPIEVAPNSEAIIYNFGPDMFDVDGMLFCANPEIDAPYGTLLFHDRKNISFRFVTVGHWHLVSIRDISLGNCITYQIVGPINGGTLCRPTKYYYPHLSELKIQLNNLYDADGNIIFKGVNKRNAGVEEIAAEGTMEDNRMFDLMGREIRNPLPGTVYIQNGRKFIAR